MEITEHPPTVSGLQAAFISDQIRILSQSGLRPSSTWRASHSTADDGLSPDAIEHALKRANDAMGQHCRRVYTPQATRVISGRAEDDYIDTVDDGNDAHGVETLVDTGDGVEWAVDIDADLTDDTLVATLPKVWSVEHERLAAPIDALRYSELVEHLSNLVDHRTQTSSRIERLMRIRLTLHPFGTYNIPNDDPTESLKANLQDNIIIRGGEIERELERMKVLLARVGGRVALLPDGEGFGSTIINRGISWQGHVTSKAEHTNMVLDST
jgi:hypothetical protein